MSNRHKINELEKKLSILGDSIDREVRHRTHLDKISRERDDLLAKYLGFKFEEEYIDTAEEKQKRSNKMLGMGYTGYGRFESTIEKRLVLKKIKNN